MSRRNRNRQVIARPPVSDMLRPLAMYSDYDRKIVLNRSKQIMANLHARRQMSLESRKRQLERLEKTTREVSLWTQQAVLYPDKPSSVFGTTEQRLRDAHNKRDDAERVLKSIEKYLATLDQRIAEHTKNILARGYTT